MTNRLLLDKIDYEKKTVTIDGKEYAMKDTMLPTVDPEHPYDLTEEEQEVMNHLSSSFIHSEKLQRHIQRLLKKGSMYRVYNGNLLYHGCVPLNEDGSFAKVNIYGTEYSGKALFDVLESYVRKAFFSADPVEKEKGMDIIWYIWTAPHSPLYGREKMATFERYFLDDEEMKKEPKNAYYTLINKPEIADKIREPILSTDMSRCTGCAARARSSVTAKSLSLTADFPRHTAAGQASRAIR
jgi:fructose-1,6-bisphosphatase-3